MELYAVYDKDKKEIIPSYQGQYAYNTLGGARGSLTRLRKKEPSINACIIVIPIDLDHPKILGGN